MTPNKVFAIGLMSGTSLDGVDLVYVSFEKNETYNFEIISAKTYSYSDVWKTKLKNAYHDSEIDIDKLSLEYGYFLGGLINDFKSEFSIENVDFIASHGHTIFHKPYEGLTIQIGNGQAIANFTNNKVICDFRTQDVALGGQGAPLVPIGDRLLFADYDYCLNLGGFANISFEKNNERLAYDICPANIVLNYFTRKIGLEYDESGKLASEGETDNELLHQLNSIEFYKKSFPKSLGYEFVESEILPLINEEIISIPSILRTFVEHIAIQIASEIKENSTVLITGGGVFNTFLIERLQSKISSKIMFPSSEIIDYKEALIFAFLGLLRIDNQVNCLKSVTGAKKDHSSGQIYTP